MATSDLTVEYLRAVLDYEPQTGVLTWRRHSHKRLIGQPAGVLSKSGYVTVVLTGVRFYAHRLAWMHAKGRAPRGTIDHRNGNRSDNRLSNLRDISQMGNRQNQRAPSITNRSGYLGVSFHKSRKRWTAKITSQGKCHHLGYFTDPAAAHEAYLAAKRQIHAGCTL